MPDYTIEEREHLGHTIYVKYDMDPPNPRNSNYNDNFGTVIAWYKGRPQGDEHHYTCAEDWAQDLLPDRVEPSVTDLPGLVLPIYIYEHGGVALSHGTEQPWDRRPIYGYSYASEERMREEKIVTDGEVDYDWARRLLDGELAEFSNWLNGSVYMFLIYPNCQCCSQPIKNEPAEEVCGGFYDQDHAMEEAVSMVEALVKRKAEVAAAS